MLTCAALLVAAGAHAQATDPARPPAPTTPTTQPGTQPQPPPPAAAQPPPTQPAPTQPAPTQPAPAQPTQPRPAQPAPAPAPAPSPSPVPPVTPPAASDSGDALLPPPEPMLKDDDPRTAVDPAKEEEKRAQQGPERPTADGTIGSRATDVFSEDWWAHTRPILEMHGYFRTRGELFHNFALNRHDAADTLDNPNLWAQPVDHTYTDRAGVRRQVLLCGDPNAAGQFRECFDKSQAHANLRLRLNPEIHISDNLRILSQIDLLDNLVLGSTPDSYALVPSGVGRTGYNSALPYGNAPLAAFSNNQGPPTAGVNGYRNSIDVKRAWAEYLTPVGQIRVGRMPAHWGLGMVLNNGDCIDCDYQTNVDRIMFTTGLKSLDLYFGGSWNFVSSGPTNASPYDVYGGQPYNTANLTNVHEWMLFAAHRTNPELQRLKLSRGDIVINGGLYTMYRKQVLDVLAGQTPFSTDFATTNNGLERRGMGALIPDAWVQLLFNKLRVEAEVASVWGDIDNSPAGGTVSNPKKIRMFGYTTQAEFRAVEDKLRIGFGHGWASGDPNQTTLAPSSTSLGQRAGDGAISNFAFHPAYYVDYIFFRRILSRIEGAYYFRPNVEYDFLRNPNGQKFGGGAAIIWSRASEFIQAPGNKRDLGVELDVQLYYQSKDGSLNDDPNKMGGFYAALQYGVFFPLPGLEYLKNEQDTSKNSDWSLSTAQTVRLILGVLF
ncbi:MAG: TIGR04551 family protein [Labilithrix sp.]|nr:TIGR04551 family protein [Labilithrix sp.]MCW5816074.1 TIGR04551 family protein [Labilithrix sp.]